MATRGPLTFPMLTPDLFQSMGRRDFPAEVSNFVLEHQGKSYNLKNPAGAVWKIGGVDDTVYKGKHSELVLMTCEDRKFYAYDGEELHVVASSLKQLCDKGIEYPASKSYNNGEAFKHMTEKDWDKVRKGAVGKSLDEAHHKLVMAEKSKFLENLA